MKLHIAIAAALLALLPATPAAAQAGETLKVAPAQLKPDKAYILFRTNRFKTGIITITPVFLRVPAEAEVKAYLDARQAAFDEALPKLRKDYEKEKAKAKPGQVPPEPSIDNFDFAYAGTPNLFAARGGYIFDDGGTFRSYLVEAPPGEYLIYGLARGQLFLDTCMCLGTVAFEAKAGQIVDLGTMLMDKTFQKSEVPELADESGFGHPPNGAASMLGLAIRRGGDAEAKPASLAAFAVTPAEYHAVGIYLEPGAGTINRIAPVPGALAYQRGAVIDVRTGKEVAPGDIAP